MTRILILGKAGPPGTAKTRLIPALGRDGAHAAHEAMARAVVAGALAWADGPVHLALDPLPASLPDWAAGTRVLSQGAGDLGRRLIRLTGRLFDESPVPLIVLGTDAPDLPGDRLDQAAAALADGDAAICPSRDGGYNLIALPAACPRLFSGIAWGTSAVAAQTRAAAEVAGVRLVETAPWEDVDDRDDLRRLRSRIAGRAEAVLRRLHADLNLVQMQATTGDSTVSDTRTVLIADDNPQILELLEAYLEPLALTIRRARDGEQVLEEVRAAVPDLLLLDIMMPKRSGYEVCRELKAEEAFAKIPIILVTALNEEGDRQRGEESGADDFISKPVNKLVLLEKVQELLGLG